MKRVFLISLLLTVITIVLFLCFCLGVSAADVMGNCGEKATYTFNSSTGELVVSGVGVINNSAFLNDNSIKKVTIEEGITSIGDRAFSFCNNLEFVTIPNTVNTISEYAFWGCSNLVNVIIPDSIITIGNDAFRGCYNLENVSIGSGVTTIEENTFCDCTKLKNIEIPDSVENIGKNAFRCCVMLTDVTFGKGLITIGESAFRECRNLKEITIPDNVITIEKYAFAECSELSSVVIGNGLTTIGNYAFIDCFNLASLNFGKNLRTIGDYAFYGCSTVIYYAGTKNRFEKIEVGIYNQAITTSDIHFNYVEGSHWTSKITRAATCTMQGLKTYSCPCGYSFNEKIEVLGHLFDTVYTVDKPSTCFNEGSESKHCTRKGCTAKSGIKAIPKLPHTYKTVTTKATLSKNGKVENKCSTCGYVSKTTTVYYPKTITLSATSYTYNGKVKTPSLTVKDSKGNALKKDTDYTVKYESGRKVPGKYTVTITFKGKYSGTKPLYFTIKPKVTSKITASQTTSTITLKWNKVTGATGYRIYSYNSSTKKYTKIANTTKNNYTIKKLKAGTKYTYLVRAYCKTNTDTVWADYSVSNLFYTSTKPSVTSKISTSQTTNSIKLTWSKVTGATGYRVYVYKNKKWTKLADVTKNTYTVKKLKVGTTYKYAVKAYKKVNGNKIWADSYKSITTATKPATPTLKVSSTSKGKVALRWTNVNGETGYQVYYSTQKDSGYKKVNSYKVNVVKGSKNKLKSGKKYYFKVRAYKKTDSGTVYSSWSSVKSVKIK